jgi:hypothetical protein
MMMKFVKLSFVASALAAIAVAPAQIGELFFTSYEAPEGYVIGQHPAGVQGWAAGSGGTTAPILVSGNIAHGAGNQSLAFDNTTGVSFYSVRRDLAGWTAASGNPIEVSTMLWIDPSTEANRIYGIYMGSGVTSTLGGTVLGLTIDGAGRVRGGTTWGSTYTAAGQWAQLDPGTYLGRWLTLTLGFNPATGAKTATIQRLGGANPSISNTWFGGAAPMNVNLGTDYFATTDRMGVAYFDDLHIVAVPEPGTMAALGLGALALLRRRRSKKS